MPAKEKPDFENSEKQGKQRKTQKTAAGVCGSFIVG